MIKIGLVFPGQGSQEVGMGRDLYNQIPKAKSIMDRADEILGFDISDIIFNGTQEELTLTEIAQPAIYIVSAMYFERFKQLGLEFDIVAGHSLGEYSALYAAGVFDFETGLKLVVKRGEAMSNATPDGEMYSIIGMTLEEVENYLQKFDNKVVVSNINAKSQIVISGYKEEIQFASKELSAFENIQTRQLNVSAAFHSPLMKAAQRIMATAITESSFNQPKCLVIPNVSAIPTNDMDIIKKLLIDQITGKVNWVDTILAMKQMNIEQLYEIGHGNVLKKINSGITLRPKCMSI